MSISLNEVKAHLEGLGVKYQNRDELENGVLVPFGLEVDGVQEEFLGVIELFDDGQVFRMQTLEVIPREWIQNADQEQQNKFFIAMLHHGWLTKYGTVEMDLDAEIRFSVEIPLADNILTQAQLALTVHAVAGSSADIKRMAKEHLGVMAQPTETDQLSLEQLQMGLGAAMIALKNPSTQETQDAARNILTEILANHAERLTPDGKREIEAILAQGSVLI